MTTPIILKITEAGKNAILDSNNTGLTLRLSQLAIGSGQYTPTSNETALQGEISRHGIVSGNIETQSHTLRFSSSITSNNEISVYEIGLMTENNVLFAVASSTNKPLLKVYPDITFVGSFGLTLDDFDASKITVVNDPNGALSIVLMQQHLASEDPHPQYAMKKGVTDLLAVLQQELTELKNRPYEGIPVWGILATTHHYGNGDEVTADLRYGKWARYAQGKILAGYSLLSTDIAEYKTMGNEFGENSHTLTVDEMPNHTHKVADTVGISGQGGGWDMNDNASNFIDSAGVQHTGGDKPHNNIQPSIVVAFWVRLPNNYTAPIFDMFWTSDSDGNNRITSTNEEQNLYLWLTAQNLVQSLSIGTSIESNAAIYFTDKANFSYPNSIGNGKHQLCYLPSDGYFVSENTTFTMDVNMADGQSLSAPIKIDNTVADIPTSVGDSVFLLGLDFATEKVKIIKTQGYNTIKILNSTVETISAEEKAVASITLELAYSIKLEEFFMNAGWEFGSADNFVWQSMYSGNPSIQGANSIRNAEGIEVAVDTTGKIVTIGAKPNADFAGIIFSDVNPVQIILGNDIGVVDNPRYSNTKTNRYDNIASPIQRPFTGVDSWHTLMSNSP